ncbi:MAG: M28 family peptidase [Sphingosinicella sp.]|uniref:M28 family peptidase n=1 Tax=Sphingosinicella sp. TaxID=1917971 RepID=UPI004037B305
MIRAAAALLLVLATAAAAQVRPSQHPPLLPPAQGEAIGAEVSGGAALRTVRALSLHHRMRGSEGYRAAAEAIRDRLTDYGLEGVEIISLPADGRIFYGTQRSRPGWNARFAELWEGSERIASWAEQPISLAQDSVSGRAEAALVDIGAGTSEGDYAGREIRGRLVLTSSQPEAVADLAVGRFGAAGIVSWAQNQRTAWWGEDESLVRWGHLDTFGDHPTFAFMVSPGRARSWQARLARGETVRLRAEVDAGRSPSAYLIPTGIIPGRRRDREIVYSCHLDHPSPGANDNASGCAGILEVARSLSRLIRDGRLPRPDRTIRFIWPPEIEGTIALLNARPEFARRTLATIHLDMIGGDTETTGSILRVHGSPPSLPSFVSDVGFAFADYVNAQSLAYASTGEAFMPLVDPDGGRRALQAEVGGFSMGSDHQVWAEGSWRIPVIYIADWPDRYIHTQRDVPDNLDPTKLRRAIFIAAASGYFLANLTDAARRELTEVFVVAATRRGGETMQRFRSLPDDASGTSPIGNALRHLRARNAEIMRSVARFGLSEAGSSADAPSERTPVGPVYRRILNQGPMNGFGYSWFDDRLARAGLSRPRLLAREDYGWGPSLPYEALNLVDGRRSVGEIRDDLAASVGDAPIEEVAEYLDTLARLGVLEAVPR